MNNWQLLIAAGAPVLTVLVGILLNERRADRIETRLERVRQDLETRIDRVEVRIDRLKEELESRMDRLKEDLEARINRIADDLKVFFRDLGRHEAEITNLKQR